MKYSSCEKSHPSKCSRKNHQILAHKYKITVDNHCHLPVNIDYFMVDECVRFLFTSCERLLRTSERSERVS